MLRHHEPKEKEMVALGIILLVAGAIVTFAVTTTAHNINLDALGWILMGAGALALIVAALRYASRANRHSVAERHMSPTGLDVVEESRTGF
jgi:uncharacterized membrane protein HdeD (DUF308 family)